MTRATSNRTTSSRTTPRRGRSKSEQKREQIIAAASAMFIEQGYESCSMEEIARLAGVSKQTLYSHFGSKEVLFSTAVEVACGQYSVWNEQTQQKDWAEQLEAFCLWFSALLLSPEAIGVVRACAADGGRSEVATLFWQAGPTLVRQQLRHFLSQQQELGNLQFDDIDTACCQLIALLHGESYTRRLLGLDDNTGAREQQHYAKACAKMFLAAYRP